MSRDGIQGASSTNHQPHRAGSDPLNPPALAEQLAAILALARERNPNDSAEQYAAKLDIIASRVAELITDCSPAIGGDILATTAQNISAAASDQNDIPKQPTVLLLNATKFHIAARDLPTDRSFTLEELVRDWSQYQINRDPTLTANKIQDLIDRGALTRTADGSLRRSEQPIVFRGFRFTPSSDLKEATGLSTRHQTRTYHQVNWLELATDALKNRPELFDIKKRNDHPFGHDRDDDLQLVIAVAVGATEDTVRGLWSPPLYSARGFFKRITGSNISDFRVPILKLLCSQCVDQLTDKLVELATAEIKKFNSEFAPPEPQQARELIKRLALADSSNFRNVANEAHTAFGITPEKLKGLVNTILVAAKEPLFDIISNNPLSVHITGRALAIAQDYVLSGSSLRGVGEKHGVRGQRVEQIITEIKALDPLIKAVIVEKELKTEVPNHGFAAELIKSLEREVISDPHAMYLFGKAYNSDPSPLLGESESHYHKRIFLAAFAGAYLDDSKSQKKYPAALKSIDPNPSSYMRKLAHRAINQQVQLALDRYQPKIDHAEVRAALATENLPCGDADVSLATKFITSLVANPSVAVAEIWKALAPTSMPWTAHRTYGPLREITLRAGKERAQCVQEVFSQPWCQRWLLSNGLMRIIDLRIIQQASLRETFHQLQIRHNQFGPRWTAIASCFPFVVKLVPRQVRNPFRSKRDID